MFKFSCKNGLVVLTSILHEPDMGFFAFLGVELSNYKPSMC